MATVKVHGTDRSAQYTPNELGAIDIQFMAQDGQPGQGSAPIPDPAGSQVPYAGFSFQFLVGATLLFDGFVGGITRDRGVAAAGSRLVNTYVIGDENAAFHGFRAYRWVRPAETTKARFLAMLAAFVPWVTDTTWVTNDVVGNMPKKTYTTETLFDEVMQEIRDLTGNTAFIEHHRAHLHPPTLGITGGLAFSDTSYDFASAFPIYNPKRSKDAIDLRTDIMVTVPKGKATASDATAIARYDADGIVHQGLVELGSGTVAEAQTKANQLLADAKAEKITYEFDTGPMTAAQVTTIPVGSLVNVTSAVLGLSSSTQRIAAMGLKYIHPDRFMVHIEAGFPVRRRRAAPRTVNPVDAMNAQADIQPCGSPMSLTEYGLQILEGVRGTWSVGGLSTACGGVAQVGCELANNVAWPSTGCGVGTGGWNGHLDRCLAVGFTAPADSDQLFARLDLNGVPWGNYHLARCFLGTVPAKDGVLVSVVGGSATPAVGDLDTTAPTRTFGAGNEVYLPRSLFSFGAGNRIIFQPAEHVTTDFACTSYVLGVGINDSGIQLTPTVQFYCLVDGTYGWIEAPPREAFDGSTTTFHLIGGYTQVDRATLNGVLLSNDVWSATDGSTIVTKGWAPKAGDIFLAHYYIPQ